MTQFLSSIGLKKHVHLFIQNNLRFIVEFKNNKYVKYYRKL